MTNEERKKYDSAFWLGCETRQQTTRESAIKAHKNFLNFLDENFNELDLKRDDFKLLAKWRRAYMVVHFTHDKKGKPCTWFRWTNLDFE